MTKIRNPRLFFRALTTVLSPKAQTHLCALLALHRCQARSRSALALAALLPMLSLLVLPLRAVGAEKPLQWGEKVRGLQLGARIVQEGSVFKVGDTIQFQAFGRNLSGKDVSLTIGNYWKVNYKIQIQTFDGKPVYMERDKRNQAMEVAGYLEGSLANGATQEISKATLKIASPSQAKKPETDMDDKDAWVEIVALKPGRYRVRLLSWGVFGTRKPGPASGWMPIEVKKE
ncbi:MAG TPA: hypothetical protein VKU00_01045 [Chthonomonadaceae bacterium]|nr:hypothetical protein [Chthonomonadaceae bacterium]